MTRVEPSARHDRARNRSARHRRGMAIRSRCSARMTRPSGRVVRAFLPGATAVEVLRAPDRRACSAGCEQGRHPALFEGVVASAAPYLSADRLARRACRRPRTPIPSGRCSAISICICSTRAGISSSARALRRAMPMTIDGVRGVRFAVWAPNARASRWSATSIPGTPGAIRCGCATGRRLGTVRAARRRRARATNTTSSAPDGIARAAEGRSGRAADRAAAGDRIGRRRSRDALPLARRRLDGSRARERQAPDAPISIYEVHLGSWLQPAPDAGDRTAWDSAIERLVPYVVDMGFTHVELLPITEHPFGGSWGYQPLGLFAPSGALRHAGGFRALRRCAARGRHRRHPRLGAGAFPDRSRMAWRASTAPRSTSISIRAKAFTRTGTPTSTISAAARCRAS